MERQPAHIVDAFDQLRRALESRGITVQGSGRHHPFFNAVLSGERNIAVFVITGDGTNFSWTGRRKHSMTDVSGCASEIMRDLLQKERAANPNVGRHAAGRVERRLPGRRPWRKGRRFPG